MGIKKIWDGEQLPPIGCNVLIRLASLQRWVPRRVTGYEIWPALDGDKAHHRININVSDENGTPNQRLLCDVRPVDWREETDE